MQRRQINYTRSNEQDADRLGIQTLSRSRYDPDAMAGFFSKMLAKSRGNAAGYQDTPDYLVTHPVTTTRISEAKARADQLAKAPLGFQASTIDSDNPLLPSGFRITDTSMTQGASGQFAMARERMRVLSGDSPRAAIREYEQLSSTGKL